MDLQGKCLCGQIAVNIQLEQIQMGACHCSICRKWGGGPFMTVHYAQPLTFSGEEYMAIYRSSAWAERGFCKQCGTHLFYRLINTTDYYLPIWLFDNTTNVIFVSQVYIDNKPEYYQFSNQTLMLTEADIMEEINSSSS